MIGKRLATRTSVPVTVEVVVVEGKRAHLARLLAPLCRPRRRFEARRNELHCLLCDALSANCLVRAYKVDSKCRATLTSVPVAVDTEGRRAHLLHVLRR